MNAPTIAGAGIAMPLVRAETCGKCKFSTGAPGAENLQCRRNPPTGFLMVSPKGALPVSAFTMTKAEDWCGEFRVKIVGLQ